jgi:hypothetical protein
MLITSLRRTLMQSGLTLAVAGAAALPASAASYTYQLITVAGAVQTNPVAVNASGAVLAYWDDSTYTPHYFTWVGGKMTTVSIANAASLSATGMNDSGNICGSYTDSSGNAHGYILYANGKVKTIDYPGSSDTYISAMNNDDDLAGSTYANGTDSGFVDIKGKFTVFNSTNFTTPLAINKHGSVTGYVSTETGSETFFVYENGVFTSTPLPNTYFSAGFAINAHNLVVGQLANPTRQEYGFFYSSAGHEKIIGPHGSTDSFATGINDNGDVTGANFDSKIVSTGYVYSKGAYTTLSIPGYTNFGGVAINNAGQVLGDYVDANGTPQTFLATPAK